MTIAQETAAPYKADYELFRAWAVRNDWFCVYVSAPFLAHGGQTVTWLSPQGNRVTGTVRDGEFTIVH